jgi:hypothetical protein
MATGFSHISPFVKANDKKSLARWDLWSDNAGCSRFVARRTLPSVGVGKECGHVSTRVDAEKPAATNSRLVHKLTIQAGPNRR